MRAEGWWGHFESVRKVPKCPRFENAPTKAWTKVPTSIVREAPSEVSVSRNETRCAGSFEAMLVWQATCKPMNTTESSAHDLEERQVYC
jgi:hypothetical protein